MKVVINACYGGFGLSPEGEDAYAKLKGINLYRYQQTKHRYKDGVEQYEKVKKGDCTGFFYHVYTKDFGDSFSKHPSDEYYWSYRDIKRNDPDLVSVVENLGEKASGDCASLRVVEIPDDVDYIIDEYDGIEHIAERHRTWA